ncbi:MAG: cytoplasmic protein [Desulfobacteraceae bacterium]|nr:cytoplasmic protein [Desulfobacteraceae bacterium]
MILKKDTHNFIQEYKGLGAFGLDRETDEETIMFYLQKFSEDSFLKTLLPRLSDQELEEIYLFVNNKIKQHFSEDEYHDIFLKDR